MQSKKICALILAILLNSCTNQTITGQNSNNNIKKIEPTPTQTNSNTSKPNPIINQEPIVIYPNPTPIPTATPQNKAFTLTAQELQAVTDSGMITANNKFGINLFLDLVKEQKNENIFISPSSVALALQMAYNGADKETKDEITKTLVLNGITLDNINNLSKLLIKKLNNPAPDIQLKVANSLWGGKGRITFKDEFKNNLTNYYSATSQELDFSDSKSVDIINKWASDNTNGKIPKVINSIDEDTLAYLMNAIYFKADWTSKFDKKDTSIRSFTLGNGTKKDVPLMNALKDFRHYSHSYDRIKKQMINEEERFEIGELTYGKDSKVSLFLFLPDEKSSLEKFYSQLNNDNLEMWLKSCSYTQGFFSFPKFKMKWEKKLNENLISLGIKKAFNSNEANFSKMSSTSSYISYVLHSSFIDVNEEGSEAAAVTVIASNLGSSPPTPRFVADRPFFYLIRDNETKSILFMGAVNNPEYEN